MKVNVLEDGVVIARVEYNSNLDFWDGHNWTCGSTGRHLGLTQLRDGRFVLIHGTQWQGERDWAETISEEEAIQRILSSGNEDLLKKFHLTRKAESTLIPEKDNSKSEV